ncbi:Phospholipid-transporting ATPase 6 [Raphanus sativus]|nr:Phospholipid-transporting ATPase 6 [Raphanus sativus]
MILVGATAVEDKLQKGYACSLLRQGMKQISISFANLEESSQNSEAAAKESILMQITNASQMIKIEKDPHAAFALIIDGKTLTYALKDDVKYQFLALAVICASVICCRVSPKQKALITRLAKEGTGKTTLAIGDGANDVGMIQEADIGVGISGVEGMQAVMASDFSIAQFRFLERLLVVHGHWCYKRIAQMICYFFYKNIAFGLTLFYFEAFTGFSGQSIFNDSYLLLFNVVLTSLPVISLGVFEQDVPSDVCLEFPALYQQGPKNLFFDWYRILGWMGNGVYASIVIFTLNLGIFHVQSFRSDGQTADMNAMGTAMFTCIIWAVNVQIALTMSHFTLDPTRNDLGKHRSLVHLPRSLRIDLEDERMWKREKSKAREKTKIGFTARVDAKIRQLRVKLQRKHSVLSVMSGTSSNDTTSNSQQT